VNNYKAWFLLQELIGLVSFFCLPCSFKSVSTVDQ